MTKMSHSGKRGSTEVRKASKRKPRAKRIDLDSLAVQQGVKPIDDPEELFADFWPEDESADQFNQAVRQWRQQGSQRNLS
jgi:hypothetical protein